MRRRALASLAGLLLLGSCTDYLATVQLALSKNCNEVEVQMLAPRVAAGAGEQVLDVAATNALDPTAWILLRRPVPGEEDELVVQRWGPEGLQLEQPLELPAVASPTLALTSSPEPGEVWVERHEVGLYEVLRIAPDSTVAPVVGSDNLVDFPPETGLCEICDTDDWPRRLIFLPTGPAVVSLPPFSTSSGLIVWVGVLNTEGALIRMGGEHRLNFEPPCDAETPEEEVFCQEEQMALRYPVVSMLGLQEDPRPDNAMIFGHRTRQYNYDGQEFPIESADVFMISVLLDSNNAPAGVLRSYSGFYEGPISTPPDAPPPPLDPTPDPPFGIAIDRFAAYGLFSNGGQLPRIVQLPQADPDFEELTEQVRPGTDSRLLQLDRDLAMGRLLDGGWEINKLFPDDPPQSQQLRYETDAPIEEVVSGGVGTFMLRKTGAPPELVRLRCPADAADEP